MHAMDANTGRQDGAGRPRNMADQSRRTSARWPSTGAGRSAVTLVELVMVLVLMGILAAVAVPRFARSSIWETEGEVSAKKVAATLRLARRMAIDRAATHPSGFWVVCSGDEYAIYAADTKTLEGEKMHPDDGWTFQQAYTVKFDTLGAEVGLKGASSVTILGHGDTWYVHTVAPTGAVRYYRGN